jgi:hypothetical protein
MNRLSWIVPIAMTALFATASARAEEPSIVASALPNARAGSPVAELASRTDEAARPAADDAAAAAGTDTKTIPIDELDNGLICKEHKRSGSRIKQTVCYTREELATNQAQSEEQIREQIREMDRSLEVLSQIEQLRRGVTSPTSGLAK